MHAIELLNNAQAVAAAAPAAAHTVVAAVPAGVDLAEWGRIALAGFWKGFWALLSAAGALAISVTYFKTKSLGATLSAAVGVAVVILFAFALVDPQGTAEVTGTTVTSIVDGG